MVAIFAFIVGFYYDLPLGYFLLAFVLLLIDMKVQKETGYLKVMKCNIIPMLNIRTNKVVYQVVIDDGYKFPIVGSYETEEEAKDKVRELNDKKD